MNIDTVPLIAPNEPLAQRLRKRRLQELGCRAAPGLPIYSLRSWLAQSIEPRRALASEAQIRVLWEQIIGAELAREPGLGQMNPDYLARNAHSAWRNLKLWQVPGAELQQAETGQLLRFSGWMVAFEARLAELGLSTLELEIAARLNADERGVLAPKVELCGFIESPPPLWCAWLECCFAERVDLPVPSAANRSVRLYVAADPADELQQALHWARARLDADPAAQVAIVDMELPANLKRGMRLAAEMVGAERCQFAHRLPLAQTGAVQTALALLRLNRSQLELAAARRLIAAPHWGDWAAEYRVRADWERRLCDLQRASLSTVELFELLGDCAGSESVAARLGAAFRQRRQAERGALEWADHFQRQLDALGWQAGEHAGRWQMALADFAGLQAVVPRMDLNQALRELDRCCQGRSPQAVAARAGGLCLLDTLEAAADYSHLWVLGMDAERWPPRPAPNPLLPVALQVRFGMPKASAAAATVLGERLVRRISEAAAEVVYSFAVRQDDLDCAPSPLLADLPPYAGRELDVEVPPAPPLEWVDCAQAPAVAATERRVRGGIGLLQSMAESPFNAFARWRLGAEPLGEPVVEFSASSRGTLVHGLLAAVWQELGDSAGLARRSESEIEELCQRAAAEQLRRFQARHGWQPPPIAALEARRIGQLAVEWLEFERGREGFAVELSEEPLAVDLGGLQFDLRLDRLDRLADGALLLIDYKTGTVLRRRDWLEMPPAQPQLPVYLLGLEAARGERAAAICFARVRSDKRDFVGIGAQEGLPGVELQDDWSALVREWREALTALVVDYLAGRAQVVVHPPPFGRTDPLAPLHRQAEAAQLEEYRERFLVAEDGA
ncbi:MAG: PD-(D/E)XK nuclease family protein [Cellvibrionales bacterium]|nr:PD-(D/E)XK nuclease family protein [Cellvibrionales bacterium]